MTALRGMAKMLTQNPAAVASRAAQRLAQTTSHLQPAPKATMATRPAPTKRHKVTVIGSGNWGCTIAKIIAENTKEHPDLFEEDVQMWVFEENYTIPKESKHYSAESSKPTKLTELINKFHENFKYLPDIDLPHNLIANSSLVDAVHNSTILVFNLPHQFIDKVSEELTGHILPFARGVSCIKGVNVTEDDISLYSESIGENLGIYVGALSGANLATEIALEKWSETTVAYDAPSIDSHPSTSQQEQLRNTKGEISKIKLTPLPTDYPSINHGLLKTLFYRPYFHVQLIDDVAGVSLGGALKNVIALAAGFVEGRGWGDNAKAAVMRVGLVEMERFGKEFFASVNEKTFTEESCGVADMITSCAGGRNFRCAKMSIAEGISIQEVEKRELNGQKLQGTDTAVEVYSFLSKRGLEGKYPLFTAVYNILKGKNTVDDLPNLLSRNGSD